MLLAGIGVAQESLRREIVPDKRYLFMPVQNGAAPIKMSLVVGGRTQRYFDIRLADGPPDYWVFLDIQPFRGRTATLEIQGPGIRAGLSSIYQADKMKGTEKLYEERYRPRFHFTSRRGWHNDPNGLVFYRGEYHLFYQHNPYGTQWGNMTWGHAVSRDLVRWKELDDAIHPDELGTIFSGSAVVDWDNTSGLQEGGEKTLVAFYTSAGEHAPRPVPFTQSIAYSNDRGKTWMKYSGNPVLENITPKNRDPKVFWHQATRRWIMALYLQGETKAENRFALFGSPDMKRWEQLSDIPAPDAVECPDLFELPVDGKPGETRWVFWGGNGNYFLGRFDGRSFTPETEPLRSRWGANSYAAQTYSDIPPSDGRRIQIAWMQVPSGNRSQQEIFPGMPFNQQMSFPRELTLRPTPEGIRLFMMPIREIEKIRRKKQEWRSQVLRPGETPFEPLAGELWDIEARIQVGRARQVGLNIRGTPLIYDAREQELTCLGKSAPLAPVDGRVALRVLVDRTSIEIFANDGRVVMCFCFRPTDSNRSLALFASGGVAKIDSMTVYQLRSAW